MRQTTEIMTGSRLHLGLFTEPWDGGRLHRGVGVMIDTPCAQVRWQSDANDSLKLAGFEHEPKLKQLVERLVQNAQREQPSGTLELIQAIPRHIGLGSGTQMALAICSLLNPSLYMSQDYSALTRLARRAKRSSIGTHGFFTGGAFVDQGKCSPAVTGQMSPVIRFELPQTWRFVLLTPPLDQGVSGLAEVEAFQKLSPMTHANAARASEISDRLPLLIHDFEHFSQAVTEFGQRVGEAFASVQGGIYRWRHAEALRCQLQQAGISGFGQSSWGPTLFALCRSQLQAEDVEQFAHEFDSQIVTRIARPLNCGAQIVSSMNEMD